MSAAGPVDIGALDDFVEGTARRVEVDGGPAVAVVRIDDDLYAIADRCTHQDVPLSEGEVDRQERTLECWKHGSAFSLLDGAPTSLPAVKPAATYTVSVEAGRALLHLDEAGEGVA